MLLPANGRASRLLEEFLRWLQDDRELVNEIDRTTHADFRPESAEERKRRLRPLRGKRRRVTLSESGKRILKGLESVSTYSNKLACVTRRKRKGKKARGNIEESKRNYAIELAYRALHPEEPHYKVFAKDRPRRRWEEPTRTVEMRLREFERIRKRILKLTRRQIIEEQVDRFKGDRVLAEQAPIWVQIRSMPMRERVPVVMRLRSQFRRTEEEEDLVQLLSAMSLTTRR